MGRLSLPLALKPEFVHVPDAVTPTCSMTALDGSDWTHHGKVRAREAAGELTLVVDGLTTQGKYYKPLIYEFFRKSWRGSRPAWGEFSVEIGMEYVGEPPWMDLDNLAKALLDAIKGYAFHDDAQVARLLVERRPGDRERIVIQVRKLSSSLMRRTLED